jgi:DNA-binding beta-propeller fold protein YncE
MSVENGPAWAVAAAGPGQVAVVDRFSDSLRWPRRSDTAPVHLPAAPCALAPAGDGLVVAVCHFGRAAVVVSSAHGVQAEVPLPFLATGAAVSGGVGFAAGLMGVLTVFDMATGAVLASPPLPGPACGMCAGPADQTAVVTGDGYAVVVDPSGVIQHIDAPPGPAQPAVDPGTGRVLIASHRQSVLAAGGGRMAPLPQGPWGLAVDAERRRIVVAGHLSATVAWLDADTLEPLGRAAMPLPYDVAVDPGDGTAWVTSPAVGVRALRLDGEAADH